MDTTVTAPRRLRRHTVTSLLGVAALGVASLGPAQAQTATPPEPRPLDALCAEVPARFDAFDDVDDDHTFAAAIDCMAAARVTLGVRAGVYDPDAPITRAQMASFLARTLDLAVGLDTTGELEPLPPDDGEGGFADVGDDDVHAESIARLAEVGIAAGGPGGLPATQYGPAQPVTRGQMAAFVARSVSHLRQSTLTSDDDFFTDDDDNVHEEPINAVAAAAIAVGDEGGAFRPGDALTRGQMSAFVMRTLALLEAEGEIGPVPDPLPTAVEVGDDAVTGPEGDVVLAVEDLPDTVSPDGDIEFGGPVRFTDAALSADRRWVAVTTIGTAHGHGWLYDAARRKAHLVDFAFEGLVGVDSWSPDDRFALFTIESAASTDLLKVVDRTDLGPTADETGFVVEVEEEAALEPPYAYEPTGWVAPHTICFELDGTAACVDAATGDVVPATP